MTRRKDIVVVWIGAVLIAIYWLSPWWLPEVARAAGVDPRKSGPFVVRLLEIYHWPHIAAMRWLSPMLQPSDAFFPPGWVLIVTQLIPMFAMVAAWWGAVYCIGKRSGTKWSAST